MSVLGVCRPVAFVRRRLISNFAFAVFRVQVGHADALDGLDAGHSAKGTAADEMDILDALAFSH